jgi:hypothetical protein
MTKTATIQPSKDGGKDLLCRSLHALCKSGRRKCQSQKREHINTRARAHTHHSPPSDSCKHCFSLLIQLLIKTRLRIAPCTCSRPHAGLNGIPPFCDNIGSAIHVRVVRSICKRGYDTQPAELHLIAGESASFVAEHVLYLRYGVRTEGCGMWSMRAYTA